MRNDNRPPSNPYNVSAEDTARERARRSHREFMAEVQERIEKEVAKRLADMELAAYNKAKGKEEL